MNSFRSLAGLLGCTARPDVVHLEAAILGGGHVDGKACGRRQQCVAVRHSGKDSLRCDIAARAATVLHHHAVLEPGFELARNQARDDVGKPASREGDHHGDVLRRVGLRESGMRKHQSRDRAKDRRPGLKHDVLPRSHAAPYCAPRASVNATDQRSSPGTGAHSTCSILGAPVSSITSRSKPRAMPLAGGMAETAARKSSSIGYCSP
jgi:hypothetical protein